MNSLGLSADVKVDHGISHRKQWEWAAILESMHSRNLLREDATCMGFAVGQEPLPSLIASFGARILATDLMLAKVDQGWINSGQHSAHLDQLYHPQLVDRDKFYQNVAFEPVDMNDLVGLQGGYDFIWSSCAFEHLGTLDNGLDFVRNAMSLVKPGGYAFHTTEYNVSSNKDTVESGGFCIYRKNDLLKLDHELRKIGCGIETIDFDPGAHPFDLTFDIPPYFQNKRPHIKLLLSGFVCTSVLIVIRKGLV